jgi:hypothetical protein
MKIDYQSKKRKIRQNFLIFGTEWPVWEVMLNDLKNFENITFINHKPKISNKFLSFLHRIHLSERINNFINLPFKRFWFKYYVNFYLLKKNTICVFYDHNYLVFNEMFLKFLSKKGCFLVLLRYNSHHLSRIPTYRHFKLIYSYDESDCREFGFIHFLGLYSKISFKKNMPNNDVVFFGVDKGRKDLLLALYDKMIKNGISCDFLIRNISQKDIGNRKICTERVSYYDLLPKIIGSSCMLEIISPGASGYTIRTIEAIIYNKKLITNNELITKFPFYNPQFMHIIKTVDDLDISFIKNDIKVEYRYDGRFSPVYLLADIEKRLLDN